MATLTIADLDNGKRDLQTVDAVANSPADTTVTRFGDSVLTLAGALRRLGYQPPVPYAPGLNVGTPLTTVEYSGIVYAPIPSQVPFTTGAWDPSQWRVVQGDVNLRDDLAGTGVGKGSGLVSFTQAGAGAFTRTLESKSRDIVSLRDFGADPSGASDSSAAISDACNFLSVGGGIVFTGPGNFKHGPLSVPDGVEIRGSGAYATQLVQTDLSSGSVTLGNASGISAARVTSAGARSSGDTINIIGNAAFLHNAEVQEYFIGVAVRGPGSNVVAQKPEIINVTFGRPSLSTGGCMVLGAMYSNLVISKVLGAGPLSGPQPSAGIRLLNGDTAVISDTNVTRHGAALLMDPDSGQNIYATQISNCLFDSAVGHSSGEITPRGGNIFSLKIANTWFGLSETDSGLLMTGYGAGVADGIELNGCEFVGNAKNGLHVAGTKIVNVNVRGGWASGNTGASPDGNGYYFSGSATDFSLTGGWRAGNIGGRGVNSGYGVRVDVGAERFLLSDGSARGNATGQVAYPAGIGTGRIRDISGLNPVGYAGVVVGPSPFTYTAGPIDETLYIEGGTVTSIAFGGSVVLNSGHSTVVLGPNESVTVSYSVAPFINKYVH